MTMIAACLPTLDPHPHLRLLLLLLRIHTPASPGTGGDSGDFDVGSEIVTSRCWPG